MYLLYTDETNLNPKEGDFFVYGGIAIPAETAGSFSDCIESIRTDAKIDPGFLLKFNPGPAHLNHQEFIEIKRSVIQAAVEAKCLLFVSLILHAVAKSPDEARRNEINRVVYHFNCFLARPEKTGLVLIDRFTDKQVDAHLKEKFSIGITGLPYTPVLRLNRILGFHYSAIGQSHFSSVIDILIGSLRYAVNAYTEVEGQKAQTAKILLSQLAPLFYREAPSPQVSNLSLNFSPNIIRVAPFRIKYEALKAFLESGNIITNQPITDQRTY